MARRKHGGTAKRARATVVAEKRLAGIVWTRERLLEAAGFRFVADTRAAVARVRAIVQAVDLQQALRACELTFELADVRPRARVVEGDATRPVAVEIYLTHGSTAAQQHDLEIAGPGGSAMPEPGGPAGLIDAGPVEAAPIEEG